MGTAVADRRPVVDGSLRKRPVGADEPFVEAYGGTVRQARYERRRRVGRAAVAALTVVMAAIGGVVVVTSAVLHGETVARFLAVGYGLASTAVLSAVVVFLFLPFRPMPGGDVPGDPVVDLAHPDG